MGGYLLAGIYMIKKKRKIPIFYFVLIFLMTVSIIFILTTPGNTSRLIQEVDRCFSDYNSLGIWEKLLMGWIDTVGYYFAEGGMKRDNYLFALLAGILLAGIWQKRQEKYFQVKMLIALLPFSFFWTVRVATYWLLHESFSRGGHIVGLFGLNRCLPTGAGIYGYFGWMPYSMNMVILQGSVYLMLMVCVVLIIYFLHGKSYETLLEITVLGAGFLSRLMIAFSPTFYVSGQRTAIYCNAAMLVVCLRNLQFYWHGHTEQNGKFILVTYCLGTICFNLLS